MRQGYEYEVAVHATRQLKPQLNLLAKDGWRVISAQYDPGRPGQPARWHVLLERERNER